MSGDNKNTENTENTENFNGQDYNGQDYNVEVSVEEVDQDDLSESILYPMLSKFYDRIVGVEGEKLPILDIESGSGLISKDLLKLDTPHVTFVENESDSIKDITDNLGYDPSTYKIENIDIEEEPDKLNGLVPEKSVAFMLNSSGYYDYKELINIIKNVPSKYLVVDFFVLEDNLDINVIESDFFVSLFQEEGGEGGEDGEDVDRNYIFEFDIDLGTESEPTIYLNAIREPDLNRIFRSLKDKYDGSMRENYFDFKRGRMVLFYKTT